MEIDGFNIALGLQTASNRAKCGGMTVEDYELHPDDYHTLAKWLEVETYPGLLSRPTRTPGKVILSFDGVKIFADHEIKSKKGVVKVYYSPNEVLIP